MASNTQGGRGSFYSFTQLTATQVAAMSPHTVVQKLNVLLRDVWFYNALRPLGNHAAEEPQESIRRPYRLH